MVTDGASVLICGMGDMPLVSLARGYLFSNLYYEYSVFDLGKGRWLMAGFSCRALA